MVAAVARTSETRPPGPATPRLPARETRSDWLRLRTLILLRWMAIAGQLTAIMVAYQVYGVQLDLGLSLMVVGAAIIANLVPLFIYPETRRLTETQAMATLLFDIAQLSALLYLTGGLNNPFALLILAPVTISATVLQLRTTVFLGLVAILAVTLLAVDHRPLAMADGTVLRVPPLFEFGFWLAIVIGVVFLGAYAWRVATEIHSMSDALLATQTALAREQKLTDLGGVVAAAAHELGTPLATIKLVSAELIEELDDPAQRADAELIRDQADRCRDILRSMGRAGKDDLHLRHAPLSTVLREAAEPHAERGKTILFDITPAPGGDDRIPAIRRQPEVIHGLRNLIQNAVDFSRTTVWIDARWTSSQITVRIADDGPGFPAQVIGRIGEPFVRRRRGAQAPTARPEYEGMGLGLFIAKTLLERTGADLSFANGADPLLPATERPDRCGAIVEVVWPRARIEAEDGAGLGENRPITA